ncbi:TIGR00645 family protein [Piscirickettsia litoralis]|uniref:UPF0114 protein BGC07_12150 n=1 Tax=Piscirickettsia litoralis TaxID=1891921 RepID=A0ABX3A3U8_9GAMM|nr:TIGR00645 family protein [Piscirickettsia litoralis]ODN43534.1 TIGR00645 family protein [Piscirickettsia litoralis]
MQRTPSKLEESIEKMIFASRWLQAPIYIIILFVLFAFIYFAAMDVYDLYANISKLNEEKLIVTALSLCDIILIANLVIIVVISGYENFVSRLDVDHKEGEPIWIKRLNHGGVKLKIAASIVAISSIQLLKVFLESVSPNTPLNSQTLLWSVIIHLTFIASALLLALMSWIEKRI